MGFWRNRSLRRPAISGVTGVLVAVATLALDRALPEGWMFGWAPPADGARVLVGAVTGAIITVSALVFWVRGMFVQLSAGQFSSRVLRWYLADRYQQQVLDFLVGVFAFTAVVTLGLGGSATAPPVSTLLALVLSLSALLVVIVTITDSARATELTEIMARVADETIQAVRDAHPPRGGGASRQPAVEDDRDGGASQSLRAPVSGWVGHIDDDALLEALPPHSTAVLRTRPGTFVLTDSVIGDVRGAADVDGAALVDTFRIARTRDVANDVELGLRNLVDIALQALAVGTRDATSAYEAINYLGAVVYEILVRDLPDRVRAGPDGRRIVRTAGLVYADYVDIAFDQIRQSGAMYPAVASSLLTVLHMLVDAVTHVGLHDRVEPLWRQIELVTEGLRTSDVPRADRDKVLRHDGVNRHHRTVAHDGAADGAGDLPHMP